MLRSIIIILILLIIGFENFAQNYRHGNNWYFGETALNFDTDPPTDLMNSAMLFNMTPYASYLEGNATYSDKNGNLLFYSDGLFVWDRTHQIMPSVLPDSGFLTPVTPTTNNVRSSVQSVVIIPIPEDSTKFYLFTNEGIPTTAAKGLYYSVLDINEIGNGTATCPLGNVISKHNHLMDSTSEAMTAVRHDNGKDFWLIIARAGTDSMFSFKVTENGIEQPIVSTIGYNFPVQSLGMKANLQGNRITLATFYEDLTDILLVIRFDNKTGVASSLLEIPVVTGDPMQQKQAFGGIFSPNGNYIYRVWDGNELYQHDVRPFGDTTPVFIGTLPIPKVVPLDPSGIIQIPPPMDYIVGQNDKVYIKAEKLQSTSSGFDKIHVINNPNEKGLACNLGLNEITAANKASFFPNVFLYSNYELSNPYQQFDFTYHSISCTDSNNFYGPIDTNDISWLWDFGDVASGIKNTDTSENTGHLFSQPGIYEVKLFGQYKPCDKNYWVEKNIIILSDTSYQLEDKQICMGETVRLGLNLANNDSVTYQWIPTTAIVDTASPYTLANPTATTTYKLLISNGCYTDTLEQQIIVNSPPSQMLSFTDTSICRGDSVKIGFDLPLDSTLYYWYPSAGLSNSYTYNPNASPDSTIQYIVGYYGQAECYAYDTVNITVIDFTFYARTDTTICAGENVNLSGFASSYQESHWNPGYLTEDSTSINTIAFPDSTTTFTLYISDSITGCNSNRTVTITVNQFPDINVCCADTITGLNQQIPLSVIGDSINVLWTPANNLTCSNCKNPLAAPAATTTYYLEVISNKGCLYYDSITLFVLIEDYLKAPTAFSPNGDLINEIFIPEYLNIKELISFNVYNRWGEKIYTTNKMTSGWDGNYNGEKQEVGLYYYEVIGTDALDKNVTSKGSFVLMR